VTLSATAFAFVACGRGEGRGEVTLSATAFAFVACGISPPSKILGHPLSVKHQQPLDIETRSLALG
jgi:hypothetical protein